MAKKPKGFRAFDELARKLVKVPPSELPAWVRCDDCEKFVTPSGRTYATVWSNGTWHTWTPMALEGKTMLRQVLRLPKLTHSARSLGKDFGREDDRERCQS